MRWATTCLCCSGWDLDASRGGNPTVAFAAQGAVAMSLVVFGAMTRDGFQAMVAYTAPVFWLFLLLVGVSYFVLRQPRAGRGSGRSGCRSIR